MGIEFGNKDIMGDLETLGIKIKNRRYSGAIEHNLIEYYFDIAGVEYSIFNTSSGPLLRCEGTKMGISVSAVSDGYFLGNENRIICFYQDKNNPYSNDKKIPPKLIHYIYENEQPKYGNATKLIGLLINKLSDIQICSKNLIDSLSKIADENK